VATGTGHHYY